MQTESVQYTPQDLKQAAQELLRHGHLTADLKPQLYKACLARRDDINTILEPLDLRLSIDEVRSIAMVNVAKALSEDGEDEWTHPLLRRQRLTLEQSLLLAILRHFFVLHEQEAGLGAGQAVVALDDLMGQLNLYLGETGSDSRDSKRLRNLLENLRQHGVVSEIDDKEQVIIRPLIAHMANPESLKALLQQFRGLVPADEALP